ncbi:MAG: DUF58 domain-containing protein [Desulfobacter sp.]|nr:MAG: DUF58 domain-containing protein [Desulfobacter sp.]
MAGAVKKFLDRPLSFRRRPRVPGQIRLGVSSPGLGFFGLILCGFLMSVNFSNNLIFAMTFLLVAIALVGGYATRVNLAGLTLSDWRTEPVFAGGEALYTLSLGETCGRNRFALAPRTGRAIQGEEIHLEKGARVRLVLKRQAPRRGPLGPAPADISSGFPLGVFRARLISGDLPGTLVYPAPAGNQPLPEQPSGTQAHMSAESGTFKDMRRYAPGDPLTRVDWKAFARFDQLYTKVFDGARGDTALWFRWEDVHVQDTEARISQLCRWILDTHKKNLEYGLEIPGTRIEPARDEEHLGTCLAALALYGIRKGSGEGKGKSGGKKQWKRFGKGGAS